MFIMKLDIYISEETALLIFMPWCSTISRVVACGRRNGFQIAKNLVAIRKLRTAIRICVVLWGKKKGAFKNSYFELREFRELNWREY